MKILSDLEYYDLTKAREEVILHKDADLIIKALENFLMKEGYDIPKYEKHYLGLDKYDTCYSTYLDYFYSVESKNPNNERKDLYIKMLENILKGNAEEESDLNGNNEP